MVVALYILSYTHTSYIIISLLEMLIARNRGRDKVKFVSVFASVPLLCIVLFHIYLAEVHKIIV